MWDLPRPGIEAVCPALADGFFTTGPPGNPPVEEFWLELGCLEVDDQIGWEDVAWTEQVEKGAAEENWEKKGTWDLVLCNIVGLTIYVYTHTKKRNIYIHTEFSFFKNFFNTKNILYWGIAV